MPVKDNKLSLTPLPKLPAIERISHNDLYPVSELVTPGVFKRQITDLPKTPVEGKWLPSTPLPILPFVESIALKTLLSQSDLFTLGIF